MNNPILIKICFIVLLIIFSSRFAFSLPKKNCSNPDSSISRFDTQNLFAWCIVPYDVKRRTPKERIEMLKELGIKSYAYDGREEHLKEFEKEVSLANQAGIKIKAVWLWIDADWDIPGSLNFTNETVFQLLNKLKLQTQIWVGFSPNYFENYAREESIKRAVDMIRYLSERGKESGSKIALYNFCNWIGEPENMLTVIKSIPDQEIGIVYSFHHAHNQISRFTEVVKMILPHLWAVNLNGMKDNGQMILPVGSGDKEKQMINTLLEAGYNGQFGIIGLKEEEDVKEVMKKNIAGLNQIMK